MNNTIIAFIFTSTVAGAILTGFDSSSSENEGIQVDHPASMNSVSRRQENQYIIRQEERVAEWKKLWIDGGEKVMANGIQIRELRSRMEEGEKTFDELYLPRIESLELTNERLQTALETYDMKEGHWESFKWQFNRDMDALIRAIHSISVDYQYD